jgi:D-3-phosphoglycerate dehydrogenase
MQAARPLSLYSMAGKWERNKYTGVSIADKTLVVFGFGKVGAEVARRGKV